MIIYSFRFHNENTTVS